MAKKPIARRTERVSVDPVTHALAVTALDAVQLAFERVVQAVDGQMVKLSAAEGETLARRLLERIAQMLPQPPGG